MTGNLGRQFLTSAARVLPPPAFARLQALAKLRYLPRLKDPRRFTERLLAKRVSDFDPLVMRTADKYTMREYVESRIGSEYLPKLYAVVEDSGDVDVAKLPQAYVMKGAHGSGYNRIVTAGELGNEEARALARYWLGQNYYRKRQEWAYRDLKPRVIFEENLAPGAALDDLKVFTFGGVPRLVQVDRDRFTHHRRSLYTPEWRRLAVECEYDSIAEPVPRPRRLDEMLGLAATLGSPFRFVRIDFYALPDGGRLVVGELTHYPESGVISFSPSTFDRELGEVWGDARPIDQRYLAS